MSGDHHQSSTNLKIAFLLNAAFTIIEIAGGYWTNSISIITDAVHDLGDSLSLGMAWYFESISRRKPTATLTYGYRRFRILGGLITGVTLLAGLGFVLYHAVNRLMHPEEVRAGGMIGLAVLGILFNGLAVLRVRKGSSLTERLVNWHLIEDTLGWVAVLLGAAIMAIWNIPIVDPILSIMIATLVLWNVGRNLKKVFAVFLQAAPEQFDADEFTRAVLDMEGVHSLHHIHCWSIDGEHHVLSCHIVIQDGFTDTATLKSQVRKLLEDDHFEHITLETESIREQCGQTNEESL
jgi:cobalt-zinc-cadmium efflux system protein